MIRMTRHIKCNVSNRLRHRRKWGLWLWNVRLCVLEVAVESQTSLSQVQWLCHIWIPCILPITNKIGRSYAFGHWRMALSVAKRTCRRCKKSEKKVQDYSQSTVNCFALCLLFSLMRWWSRPGCILQVGQIFRIGWILHVRWIGLNSSRWLNLPVVKLLHGSDIFQANINWTHRNWIQGKKTST